MQPTISIIICTYNRAESLKPTLDSIGQAIVPEGWKVELLVVDNASMDETPHVIATARLTNVHFRSIRELKPGLSHARNAGLHETSGEIIVFTDDDIRVPANWIIAMCEPLLNGTADAVAGGVVFPPEIAARMSQPPLSAISGWLASTEELKGLPPKRMVGANMAFHRRVLDKVPGFDIEVGPGKNSTGSGDDTLFSLQLQTAEYRLVGAFQVTVEHHFDLRRLEIPDLFSAARAMGRTHAFIFYHWEHSRSRIGWLRLLLSQVKRRWGRFFYPIDRNSHNATLLTLLNLEWGIAFQQEYRRQSRRPHKYTLKGLRPIAVAQER